MKGIRNLRFNDKPFYVLPGDRILPRGLEATHKSKRRSKWGKRK